MFAALRTEVGKVREINEDYVFISEPYANGNRLAVVADGMGGHLAGEVASKIAVETIFNELITTISETNEIEHYRIALEKAIEQANLLVFKESNKNDGYRGMGTTVIAALINPDWIIIGHIGDSRAYLIGDDITQLTDDHSLVNELVKSGQISEEDALSHPQKNVLTRALGTDLDVEIDTHIVNWEKGQYLLMCTDGLTNHLSNEMIVEGIKNSSTTDNAIDKLVDLALDKGGDDNISVILVRNE